MKLLIIEDDPLASRLLKIYLNRHFKELELLDIVVGVEEARQKLNQLDPDIVISDINIRGGSSLPVFQGMSKRDFRLIFTTAYDHYAAEAFKLSAFDYLVKPIDETVFVETVERAMNSQIPIAKYPNDSIYGPNRDKLAVATSKGYRFISFKDVILISAEGPYSKISLKDGTDVLSSTSLSNMERELNQQFCRVHHGHIINLNEVVEFKKGLSATVLMTNNSIIDISVRKKKTFIDKVQDFFKFI